MLAMIPPAPALLRPHSPLPLYAAADGLGFGRRDLRRAARDCFFFETCARNLACCSLVSKGSKFGGLLAAFKYTSAVSSEIRSNRREI